MPDLLTILIREVEAHEDSKSQWHDPMMWLTRLQALNNRYIHLRLSEIPLGDDMRRLKEALNGRSHYIG